MSGSPNSPLRSTAATDLARYREDGSAAHCRRVAAYCREIGTQLRLSTRQQAVLRQAALQHHQIRFTDATLGRLMDALRILPLPASTPAASPTLKDRILAILDGQAFAASPEEDTLSAILQMANHFDEQLEADQFFDRGISEIINHAIMNPLANPAAAFVLPDLRKCSRADLLARIPQLPVYPEIAVRVMDRLRNEDLSLEATASLASSDPVLAGNLMSAAGTALCTRERPVRNLVEAISCIGTEKAGRILMATSLAPLLFAPGHEEHWRHATESAAVAESIARMAGIPAGDAYILGLIHDAGSLLLRIAPLEARATLERLRAGGVQIAIAEALTCGDNHAGAGAEVLRAWKLPSDFATAVEYHHEPERTDCKLAALLYVVEYWTSSEEDLPSTARLRTCLGRLGLTMDSLSGLKPAINPWVFRSAAHR